MEQEKVVRVSARGEADHRQSEIHEHEHRDHQQDQEMHPPARAVADGPLYFPSVAVALFHPVELLPDYRSHTTVIKMRSSVPHAVAFANGNVIHLRSNVMVQAVLPNVGVSVVRDRKGRYAYHVHSIT